MADDYFKKDYNPDKATKYLYKFADNGWADHICAECGYTENTDVHVSLDWKFCPGCGRRIVNHGKIIFCDDKIIVHD